MQSKKGRRESLPRSQDAEEYQGMKRFQAMGRLSFAAAAVALLATSPIPAAAATRDPAGEAKQERTDAKDSQKICVSDTFVGTRVPRKVCKTRAQWIAEEGAAPGER